MLLACSLCLSEHRRSGLLQLLDALEPHMDSRGLLIKPKGDHSVGLFATKPFPPYSVVMSVPPQFILSLHGVPEGDCALFGDSLSEIDAVIAAVIRNVSLPGTQTSNKAALLVMHHAYWLRERSPFHALLSSYPPDEEMATPPFFSEQELEWFQGTLAHEYLAYMRNAYREFYETKLVRLCEELPVRGALGACTYEEWRWARSMVQTRGFTIRRRVDKEGCKLKDYIEYMAAPIAELMDHSDDPGTSFWAREAIDQPFKIVTFKAVQEGQELLHTYTNLGSTTAFVSFGFVPDALRNDYVSLFPEPVPGRESEAPTRLSMLEGLQLLSDVRLYENGTVPSKVVLAEMVRGLSPRDLDEFGVNFNQTLFLTAFLSFRDKLQARRLHAERKGWPPSSVKFTWRQEGLAHAVRREAHVLKKCVENMDWELGLELRDYCKVNGQTDLWLCSREKDFPPDPDA